MHLRPACKSGRKCPSKPGQPLLLLPSPGLPLVPANQVRPCHELKHNVALRHRNKDVHDGIPLLLTADDSEVSKGKAVLHCCKLVWQSAIV